MIKRLFIMCFLLFFAQLSVSFAEDCTWQKGNICYKANIGQATEMYYTLSASSDGIFKVKLIRNEANAITWFSLNDNNNFSFTDNSTYLYSLSIYKVLKYKSVPLSNIFEASSRSSPASTEIHLGGINMVMAVDLTAVPSSAYQIVFDGYIGGGMPTTVLDVDIDNPSPTNNNEGETAYEQVMTHVLQGTYADNIQDDHSCNDGVDNDLNYKIDCKDVNCDGVQIGITPDEDPIYCEYRGETTCWDGYDNDHDGSVDESGHCIEPSPIINILSPVNNSVYHTTSIDLDWTLDKHADWCAYSLDGEINTTVIKYNTICWGGNIYDQSSPYYDGDAVQVSAAEYHACVLKSDGDIECWGQNNYSQSDPYNGGDAIQVSAGSSYTCILKSDNNVECRGYNGSGQVINYNGGDAVQVSTGEYHTCILKSDNNVECWGRNNYGQAENYTGGNVIQVSAGRDHTCILKLGKNVECWGSNIYSQSDPYYNNDAIQVSAGGDFTCAIIPPIKDINLTGISEGPHNVTVACSVTGGNSGSATSYFTVELGMPIHQGWNLFSPVVAHENKTQNISLTKGWNMFGYSSPEPLLWYDAYVNNGTEAKRVNETDWIQSTIYYYENSTYQFDDAYLRQNKGYWLYAFEDDLTLMLPGVGGYEQDPHTWIDAMVSNGSDEMPIQEAELEGWLQDTIYYYDPVERMYNFIPGDDDHVYPWKGYWLYSNEDLNLIIASTG